MPNSDLTTWAPILSMSKYFRKIFTCVVECSVKKVEALDGCKVAMTDTHVFVLNEYFVDMNIAKFNILNEFLN